MRIPLPFPKCGKCNKTWKQCIHHECKGLLEIDPTNYTVYCLRCKRTWSLWDSTYNCVCGNSFEATEVKDAVKTMLEISVFVINEYEKSQNSKSERESIAEISFKAFINSFASKLGSLAGMAVEVLLRMFK